MELQEILNKEILEAEEISYLLNLTEEENLEQLFQKSLGIKNLYLGRSKNKIAAIQFSNYCENNCIYCNLRGESNSSKRFRLNPEEILQIINNMAHENITNIILQSGSDKHYDTDMISYLIYKIKKEHDLEITLDLLEREYDEYRSWKFAGADNYLLKFNTANKGNFSFFHRGNNLQERLQHIKYLQRLGYKICTGNIVGLPYQTIDDITNDLILMMHLKPEMVLNTPFIPQQFTQYQNWVKPNFATMSKVIAVSRILMKKVDIIVSDSKDLYSIEERNHLFKIGANTLVLDYSKIDHDFKTKSSPFYNKRSNTVT